MGSGQPVRLRQCALTSRLPGPIDIDHDPLLIGSIKQAAGGRKRVASQHIFLKERPERLHTRLIESREIPRQGGAMRQAVATKQGHKGVCPRRESFVEREQGRLARQHVAEQHGNKIDELVTSQSGRGRSVPVPGSVSRFPCGREPEQKQQLPP